MSRRKVYTPEKAYCQSKAAQILCTGALNTKLGKLQQVGKKMNPQRSQSTFFICDFKGYERIAAVCIHPGVVRTGLYQHVDWMTVGDKPANL